MPDSRRRPGLAAPLAVWAVLAADAALVARTYSRVPPSELYGVRRGGARGGAGRLLTFACYPAAVIAPATLPPALARCGPSPRLRGAALAATALCSLAALPGVVREDRLDGGPANAPPALGVALAGAVVAASAHHGGVGRTARASRADRGRLAAAAALLALSPPWLAAEAGRHVAELGPLRRIFRSWEPTPGQPELASVHLGHHEGLDGVLIALAALALSREAPALRPGLGRELYAFALALMALYGAAVAAGDAWHEQVVKRGWTRRRLPSVLRPRPTPAWAALLAAAAALRGPLSGR
jgi:hypothetical protein